MCYYSLLALSAMTCKGELGRSCKIITELCESVRQFLLVALHWRHGCSSGQSVTLSWESLSFDVFAV